MVINDDMSYKDMLLDILQIKYISDNSIIKFLEKMVNPEVRTGEEQTQYVRELIKLLAQMTLSWLYREKYQMN